MYKVQEIEQWIDVGKLKKWINLNKVGWFGEVGQWME